VALFAITLVSMSLSVALNVLSVIVFSQVQAQCALVCRNKTCCGCAM